MKVGDLVKMKYEMWWRNKNANPSRNPHRVYTDQTGIVYGIAGNGLKVLMPDNTIKLGLVNQWKVVNENR